MSIIKVVSLALMIGACTQSEQSPSIEDDQRYEELFISLSEEDRYDICAAGVYYCADVLRKELILELTGTVEYAAVNYYDPRNEVSIEEDPVEVPWSVNLGAVSAGSRVHLATHIVSTEPSGRLKATVRVNNEIVICGSVDTSSVGGVSLITYVHY